ncbi:MAG: glycosyltransferase WbuB [Geobacteraceae bacterium GWB2_52_12]|nr:MAG: glycosyltransferase WbuB [Geobacteraceae bacterium GWB2_52_12]
MKILFLAPFGIRPKGTVIARMLPLAVELQNLGHTVTIVAPPYTNPEDSGKTEELRGVRLVNVTLPVAGKALGALPLAWRMFTAARAEQPDVVHLFKPKGYGGLAAMLHLVLKTCGMRMAPLFVDGDDWEGKGGMNDLHSYSLLERRLFAFQEQWLPLHSSGVTVASLQLKELMIEAGISSEKILYLPNCVDALPPGNGLQVREQLGIPAETPILLLYTRFFEFSQNRLHRILSGIHQAMPLAKFLIVGKGRQGEEEQLDSAARTMGFAKALFTVGWLEPGQIAAYLAAADAAIYPLDDTLLNRAKCPAKLTEIISAGVPVVADRVGQAAEYLDDALLCSPSQPDEMIAKAVALLSDREEGKLSGEKLRQQLLTQFKWSDYALKLHDFYHMCQTIK